MNTDTNAVQQAGQFRPKLSFYHPNAKGTGCAMSMELHPAHDRTDGCIMMRVANQMTVGSRMGPNPTFPRFDWENVVCVKLDFNDLTKMLQVFRGECETLEDGHGLYHTTVKATTRIVLRHLVEPVQGYSLELYRTPVGRGEEIRTHMLLNPAEALGICESVAGALYLVSFGIPMLVPHDTSAYEAENRRARDVAAA